MRRAPRGPRPRPRACAPHTVRHLTPAPRRVYPRRDDYLDAFADAAVLGKVGTDIQDNKCSWLVVQALAACDDAQRKLLKDHYGKHDEASVALVKALYKDLKLEAIFEEYERASHAEIVALIATTAAGSKVPPAAFTSLLDKIYKRVK